MIAEIWCHIAGGVGNVLGRHLLVVALRPNDGTLWQFQVFSDRVGIRSGRISHRDISGTSQSVPVGRKPAVVIAVCIRIDNGSMRMTDRFAVHILTGTEYAERSQCQYDCCFQFGHGHLFSPPLGDNYIMWGGG